MELAIHRKTNDDHRSTGELTVDGVFLAHTIEDTVRDLKADGSGKVYGKTAIPAGRYPVNVTWSPKFQKDMVGIFDVPFFTGIRIHGGRNEEDSLGCPLVGFSVGPDGRLQQTLEASGAVKARVLRGLEGGGKVWITITNDFPEGDIR